MNLSEARGILGVDDSADLTEISRARNEARSTLNASQRLKSNDPRVRDSHWADSRRIDFAYQTLSASLRPGVTRSSAPPPTTEVPTDLWLWLLMGIGAAVGYVTGTWFVDPPGDLTPFLVNVIPLAVGGIGALVGWFGRAVIHAGRTD